MNGFRIAFSAATLAALVSAFGVNATRVITTWCTAAFASAIIAWPSLSLAGFGPAASMRDGRVYHTATLLPSGLVLVAGGMGELMAGGITTDITFASAELFDPASNTWSAAGSMATARGAHTATLLPSGRVLVAGGVRGESTNTPLASAELFDPASSTWSTAGSMATDRSGHTATLLPSGRVLVVGGAAGPSAELYDPASNTWSATGSMATARGAHTATLLPSGQVLVAGGIGPSGTLLASAELFDPAGNTWSAAGSMATARVLHTATLLPSGKVLAAGGERQFSAHLPASTFASTELYDPASNMWSAAGSMTTGRGLHTATLLASGQVLVAGGEHTEGFGIGPVASAEVYDPASDTWSAADSMATARINHTATLLPAGKVLVAGGFGSQLMGGTPIPILASAELYDPQTQTAVEYYYAAWSYYFITSFPAEIAALDAGAFGGLWQRTGQTFNVWPLPMGVASPTCRFFSTAFAPKSSHFYTPFPIECTAVKSNPSWQYESIAFYIQIPTGYGTGNGFCPQGTVVLYRAYNNGMGGAPNHRYMTNLGILGLMLAQGWTFEGEANTKVFACVPQ